jgi:CRP-like cAMP-binding protein
MCPDELAQLLARSRLFEGLRATELDSVIPLARRRWVEGDAFFFHQGDPATTLYVLIEGRIRLTQVTSEGHQVLLRFVGAGQVFGGIAVLGDRTYPVSAQAVDDCLALAWAGETVYGLMERQPRIALNALRLLTERVQELQDRCRELATERVERRVARALLRLARHAGQKVESGVLIDLPLSRQDVAEMTGTTLYTVSRILSRWEQQGLVEAGRERVLIRHPHGLVIIAEDLPQGFSAEETI